MRSGLRYTLATGAVALLVGILGALWSADARAGVWAGVGLGFAVQAVAFWLLFVWLFPGQRLLAHGLGVAGRFVAVGLMALLWVPRLGVPAAPTLFALVAVFLGSTMLEPLFLQTDSETRR